MKLNGIQPKGPNVAIVAIPRPPETVPVLSENGNPTGEFTEKNRDLVFKAQAVLDFSPFHELVKKPEPKVKIQTGTGLETKDVNDPKYRIALLDYLTKQSHWVSIQSLAATETLEWDKVDLSNPETWHLYLEELKEAGLSNQEINKVVEAVNTANGLDDAKFDEARKRFLASQGAHKAS